METHDELLPCPFCGSRPVVVSLTTESEGGREHVTRIVCLNCVGNVSIRSFPISPDEHKGAKKLAKAEAYARWNRRTLKC